MAAVQMVKASKRCNMLRRPWPLHVLVACSAMLRCWSEACNMRYFVHGGCADACGADATSSQESDQRSRNVVQARVVDCVHSPHMSGQAGAQLRPTL